MKYQKAILKQGRWEVLLRFNNEVEARSSYLNRANYSKTCRRTGPQSGGVMFYDSALPEYLHRLVGRMYQEHPEAR